MGQRGVRQHDVGADGGDLALEQAGRGGGGGDAQPGALERFRRGGVGGRQAQDDTRAK